MSTLPDVLYLSASSKLKGFDRPLLQALAKQVTTVQWEYCQTLDEPSSLDAALVLLHDYLKQHCRPVHLVGHGTSGLLALLYTQRHPEQVRSLTLLSVGVYPAQDWQSHYYTHRQLLSCSRQRILIQMVHDLFGFQSNVSRIKSLMKILEQDLDYSLSLHSLVRRVSLPPVRVTVPLLVCGSVDDVVIDPDCLRSWQNLSPRRSSCVSALGLLRGTVFLPLLLCSRNS